MPLFVPMSSEKFTVMTVVGTRPEIIRLSRIIAFLRQLTCVKHVLVHTGQNYDYELNEIFFRDLQLASPDHVLSTAGGSACATIANVMLALEPLLVKEAPDAFLVLGDTNSCFSALVAKKLKIPVFHVEAGNRCFDQRVPEEVNRRIIDHFSDINLCYSPLAASNLLREGLPTDRIIVVGSPMFEVLGHYRQQIDASEVLTRLNLGRQQYFLVSTHREENVSSEEMLREWVGILNDLAQTHNVPVIVSTHPRTRKRIDVLQLKFNDAVQLLKPLGFLDYCKLQQNAIATLSDSGTISEESCILNFPALNLRETHERPEAMEEAAVIMVGMSKERIFQGLDLLRTQKRGDSRTLSLVSSYTVSNVSEKIARIILSYTDYVNRVVWQKELCNNNKKR